MVPRWYDSDFWRHNLNFAGIAGNVLSVPPFIHLLVTPSEASVSAWMCWMLWILFYVQVSFVIHWLAIRRTVIAIASIAGALVTLLTIILIYVRHPVS